MADDLLITDDEAAAVAKAPRVSLADIEAAIVYRIDKNGWDLLPPVIPPWALSSAKSLKVLSICLLVMKNGFTVVGKSAPASPENYDEELGKKFAYEDCIRQLWPLMGFALRESLSKRASLAQESFNSDRADERT